MSTLLLRLAAPMQSWGISSKFNIRDTEHQPSKSGVIGMLAAAIGISREDLSSIAELNDLKFGMRVDREGVMLSDYHTTHEEKFWSSLDGKYSHITKRYYLCDAIFLVGLSCDDRTRLETYEYALTHPVWPLFLGRRSCPPTLPLVLGIRDKDLEAALRDEPLLITQNEANNGKARERVLIEDNSGIPVKDLPISFNPNKREFSYRKQKEFYVQHNTSKNEDFVHDVFEEVVKANEFDADET